MAKHMISEAAAPVAVAVEGTRRRMKAERPQQILDAGFEEFAARGYAAARLEDVARRVGVSKGTIYLYFESKMELFKAVVRAFIVPIFEETEAAIANHKGSMVELLKQQLLESYKDVVDDRRDRELMRMLIAEGEKFPELTDFYHEEVMMRGERAIRSIFEAGVANGEFRDSVLRQHPMMVFSPMVMGCVWLLLFGDRHAIHDESYIEAHLDLVLNGLLAKPAA